MLSLAFQVLPPLMVLGFVLSIWRTSGQRPGAIALTLGALWLGGTGLLAQRGALAHFDPPRLPLLLLPMGALLVWAARAEWGQRLARLPVQVLVGFQAFRILVEYGIHQAAIDGIAPVEMSWSGWNFDVLTGISALMIAPFAARVPGRVLQAWNAAGLALLLIVVVTGMLAMPTPFRQIITDPPNVWITHFPYIWLPTVHVTLAFLGHLLLFKALAGRAPVR